MIMLLDACSVSPFKMYDNGTTAPANGVDAIKIRPIDCTLNSVSLRI